MSYAVSFSPRGGRSFRKLPSDIQKMCIACLKALIINPREHGMKKMVDGPYYRARLGEYRIIYDICDREMRVVVIDVGHRRDIYRNR